MVLVEQFFHLTEQNHVLISNLWRVLPVIFILTGSLSGIVYAFLFGLFKQRFSNRCVFFSELYQNTKIKHIESSTLVPTTEHTPRLSEIQWTSDETCHFLQFTPVFCSIFGFVVLALFVMFGKGGNSTKNGLRAPWRIVMPSLLFSLIFSLLCVMSLRYYNRGIYQFCNDFLVLYFNSTDQSNCNLVINNVSAQVAVDVVKQHQRLGEYFNRHDMPYEDPNLHNVSLLQSNDLMYLCEMFLRIAMSAWILCALFLLIRIVTVVDFQLVRITVRTVEVLDEGYIIHGDEESGWQSEKILKQFDMEDEDELKAPKVQLSQLIAKNPQIKLAQNTYATTYKDSASQIGSISPDIDSNSRTKLVEFTEQTDAEIDGRSIQAVGAESKVKVDTRWFSGVIQPIMPDQTRDTQTAQIPEDTGVQVNFKTVGQKKSIFTPKKKQWLNTEKIQKYNNQKTELDPYSQLPKSRIYLPPQNPQNNDLKYILRPKERSTLFSHSITAIPISNGQASIQHEEIFYDAKPNLKKPIMQTPKEPIPDHVHPTLTDMSVATTSEKGNSPMNVSHKTDTKRTTISIPTDSKTDIKRSSADDLTVITRFSNVCIENPNLLENLNTSDKKGEEIQEPELSGTNTNFQEPTMIERGTGTSMDIAKVHSKLIQYGLPKQWEKEVTERDLIKQAREAGRFIKKPSVQSETQAASDENKIDTKLYPIISVSKSGNEIFMHSTVHRTPMETYEEEPKEEPMQYDSPKPLDEREYFELLGRYVSERFLKDEWPIIAEKQISTTEEDRFVKQPSSDIQRPLKRKIPSLEQGRFVKEPDRYVEMYQTNTFKGPKKSNILKNETKKSRYLLSDLSSTNSIPIAQGNLVGPSGRPETQHFIPFELKQPVAGEKGTEQTHKEITNTEKSITMVHGAVPTPSNINRRTTLMFSELLFDKTKNPPIAETSQRQSDPPTAKTSPRQADPLTAEASQKQSDVPTAGQTQSDPPPLVTRIRPEVSWDSDELFRPLVQGKLVGPPKNSLPKIVLDHQNFINLDIREQETISLLQPQQPESSIDEDSLMNESKVQPGPIITANPQAAEEKLEDENKIEDPKMFMTRSRIFSDLENLEFVPLIQGKIVGPPKGALDKKIEPKYPATRDSYKSVGPGLIEVERPGGSIFINEQPLLSYDDSYVSENIDMKLREMHESMENTSNRRQEGYDKLAVTDITPAESKDTLQSTRIAYRIPKQAATSTHDPKGLHGLGIARHRAHDEEAKATIDPRLPTELEGFSIAPQNSCEEIKFSGILAHRSPSETDMETIEIKNRINYDSREILPDTIKLSKKGYKDPHDSGILPHKSPSAVALKTIHTENDFYNPSIKVSKEVVARLPISKSTPRRVDASTSTTEVEHSQQSSEVMNLQVSEPTGEYVFDNSEKGVPVKSAPTKAAVSSIKREVVHVARRRSVETVSAGTSTNFEHEQQTSWQDLEKTSKKRQSQLTADRKVRILKKGDENTENHEGFSSVIEKENKNSKAPTKRKKHTITKSAESSQKFGFKETPTQVLPIHGSPETFDTGTSTTCEIGEQTEMQFWPKVSQTTLSERHKPVETDMKLEHIELASGESKLLLESRNEDRKPETGFHTSETKDTEGAKKSEIKLRGEVDNTTVTFSSTVVAEKYDKSSVLPKAAGLLQYFDPTPGLARELTRPFLPSPAELSQQRLQTIKTDSSKSVKVQSNELVSIIKDRKADEWNESKTQCSTEMQTQPEVRNVKRCPRSKKFSKYKLIEDKPKTTSSRPIKDNDETMIARFEKEKVMFAEPSMFSSIEQQQDLTPRSTKNQKRVVTGNLSGSAEEDRYPRLVTFDEDPIEIVPRPIERHDSCTRRDSWISRIVERETRPLRKFQNLLKDSLSTKTLSTEATLPSEGTITPILDSPSDGASYKTATTSRTTNNSQSASCESGDKLTDKTFLVPSMEHYTVGKMELTEVQPMMELSQTYFVNPESRPSSNILYFKSDPTMVTMIYPIREPMETIGSSSETSTNPSETISSETGSSLLFSEGETLAANSTIPIQCIPSPKASTIPVSLTETGTTISGNESETTTNTLESETDSIVFSNESSLLFNASETITNFGVTLAVGNEIETESLKEAAKSVKFLPVNTTSVYEVKGAYSEDDEDTETEAVTHSVDQSSVTLASPELSDDGIELLELEKDRRQETSEV